MLNNERERVTSGRNGPDHRLVRNTRICSIGSSWSDMRPRIHTAAVATYSSKRASMRSSLLANVW